MIANALRELFRPLGWNIRVEVEDLFDRMADYDERYRKLKLLIACFLIIAILLSSYCYMSNNFILLLLF